MNIGVQDARAKGIEWVRSEYDRLKEDVNREPSYYNVISIALSELEQEQEQEGREQKQVEHIDGFIDVAQQVFEALFPEEVYGKLLGLTEYEDKRQDFYKLSHATYAEQLNQVFEAQNLVIAAKDEKIQTLTKQGLETENQLTAARKERDDSNEQIHDLATEITEREEQLRDVTARRDNLEKLYVEENRMHTEALQKNAELHNTIAELQSKLEQATKPKEPVSDNLQSLINSVKIKSIKDLTASEMEQRFLDRMTHGGKVMSIEPPSIGETRGNTFRLEDIPGADQEAVVEESFRSETESLPEAQPGADSTDYGGQESTVGENTEKTVEQRVAELERKMAVVEDRLFTPVNPNFAAGAGVAFEVEVT